MLSCGSQNLFLFSFYMVQSLRTIRNTFYSVVGSLIAINHTFAATTNSSTDPFGLANASQLNTSTTTATSAAQAFGTLVKNLLTLISIIAVAYVLWAGFQIMTAAGEEEKVKKGRQTIIYVIVGIVVMWLAYWIVSFVLNALAGTTV